MDSCGWTAFSSQLHSEINAVYNLVSCGWTAFSSQLHLEGVPHWGGHSCGWTAFSSQLHSMLEQALDSKGFFLHRDEQNLLRTGTSRLGFSVFHGAAAQKSTY